jgi:hypothetical protein
MRLATVEAAMQQRTALDAEAARDLAISLVAVLAN